MADEEFDQFRAFAFLNEVKNKFLQQFGIRWRNALAYSMQTAFSRTLAQLMVSLIKKIVSIFITFLEGILF